MFILSFFLFFFSLWWTLTQTSAKALKQDYDEAELRGSDESDLETSDLALNKSVKASHSSKASIPLEPENGPYRKGIHAKLEKIKEYPR